MQRKIRRFYSNERRSGRWLPWTRFSLLCARTCGFYTNFMKTKATALISIVGLALLALHFTLSAQDSRKPEPTKGIPNVVKDRVKGSIHHAGGKKDWQRIRGKAQVIDAHTLQFDDGTRVPLN